jgi:hypothetical protein
MPKKPNPKKAASAQYQNIKALAEAASGAEGMEYLTVEKPMGNRYFLCLNAVGQQVLAEPRKLFTRGSMRVEKGGIVVAQAPVMPAWKQQLLAQQRAEHMAACKRAKQSGGNAPAPDLGLPYEIVGVIAERSEAKRLIKARAMPQSILDQAIAAEAGSAAGAEPKALLADDLEFMTPEEEARQARQEMLAAMTPEERAEYLAKAQMARRIQMAAGGSFENSGLDQDELSEFRAKDEGHHASRGMKQARLAADARASIQQRLSALLSGSKKTSVRIEVGDALVEDDAPVVTAWAAPTRFKQLRPKMTEEQKAAARSKADLDDIIVGLMGVKVAAESSVHADAARLRAELAAMPEVEDWEAAADEEELCVDDL